MNQKHFLATMAAFRNATEDLDNYSYKGHKRVSVWQNLLDRQKRRSKPKQKLSQLTKPTKKQKASNTHG